MRIAIVGSRNYVNLQQVFDYVKTLPPDTTIISGGAVGVDRAAAKAARECNLTVIEFLPDWDSYGRSAGFRRNYLIVKNCDKVVAFWDGTSKGTKNTIDLAKQHNKELEVFLDS